MRRRALLTLLPTVLLAGCEQPTTTPAATNTTQTPTPTQSTARNPGAVFGFDVSVVQARPTAASPPVIEISVTNQSDETHLLTIANHAFPFATPESTGDPTLLLDEDIPSTREGDCWTSIPKQLPMYSGHQFTPGNTVTREYAVLNPTAQEACWPAGEYRFTQTYALDPETPNTTDGGTPFEWGFTLNLSDEPTLSVSDTHPPTQLEGRRREPLTATELHKQ